MPAADPRIEAVRKALFELRFALRDASDKEKLPVVIKEWYRVLSDLARAIGEFRLDARPNGLVLDLDEKTLEGLNPFIALDISSRLERMGVQALRCSPPLQVKAVGALLLGLVMGTPADAVGKRLAADSGVAVLPKGASDWLGGRALPAGRAPGAPSGGGPPGAGTPPPTVIPLVPAEERVDLSSTSTQRLPPLVPPTVDAVADPFETSRFDRSSSLSVSAIFQRGGSVRAAMTQVDATLIIINQIEDQDLRRSIKGDLVKRILATEPGISLAGGAGRVLGLPTAEEISRLLGEIRRWLVSLRLPPASLREGLQRLKGTWDPLAALFHDDPAAHQKLLDLVGVADISVAREANTIDRAREISQLSGIRLYRELQDGDPGEIAALLRDHGDEPALLRIVEGLDEALALPFPEVRDGVPRVLEELARALVLSHKSIGLGAAERALTQALDLAPESQHERVAALLAEAVILRLETGNLEKALQGILALARSAEGVEKDPRVLTARRFLDQIAGEAAAAVIDGLLASGAEDRNRAEQIAAVLGEPFAAQLVQKILRSDSSTDRRRLVGVLRALGRPGVVAALAAIAQVTEEEPGRRLLPVIEGTSEKRAVIDRVAPLLTDPLVARRRLAVDALSFAGGDLAGALLAEVIPTSPESDVRVRALRAIAQLKAQAAIPSLARFIEDGLFIRDEAAGVELARCLSIIGGPEGVALLRRLALGGSEPDPPLSVAVRRQAAHGLVVLRSFKEATEALSTLLGDEDAEIRKLAESATALAEATGATRTLAALGEVSSSVGDSTLAVLLGKVDLENSGFAGKLEDLPLDQIFQVLESMEKSGLLRLSIRKRVAKVFFHKGRVIHALCDKLEGEEAIYALVGERSGLYMFEEGPSPATRTLDSAVKPLLLEAFRRLDVQERAPKE